MLPRARLLIAGALSSVLVVSGLAGSVAQAADARLAQAAPAATATLVTANRQASSVYTRYRTTLNTISASKATIKKYGGYATLVVKDQRSVAGLQASVATDKAVVAAWAAALAGVKRPATFVPTEQSPIASALKKLASVSVKARKKLIRKKLASAKSSLSKHAKSLAKAKKKLAADSAKATKYAPRVAAANAALAAANEQAPGVSEEFTAALDALNAVTGRSAYTATRGTVQAINPGPECVPGQQIGLETVFECGVVTKVKDGDTVLVDTTDGRTVEVRNTAIQAAEVAHPPLPAQCFAGKAKTRMLDLLMPKNSSGVRVGRAVQLRAQFEDSVNLHNAPRPYRSIYVFDAATGGYTYDVQRDLAQRGLVMWFPVHKPTDPARETYYHGEYLDDINIAAAQRLGMFAPQACGTPVLTQTDGTIRDPQYDITPLLHVSWVDGDEYIDIKNPSMTKPLNISRWKLRNKNLEFFTFPEGSILPAGAVGRLYTHGIPESNSNPFVWDWARSSANINSPVKITCSGLNGASLAACTDANKDFLMGTGIYLMDYQAGYNSATGEPFGGNLRAFQHVPCNYTYATNSIGSMTSCNAAFTMAVGTLDTQGVIGVPLANAQAALQADGYTAIVTQGTGNVVTKAVLTFTGFNAALITLTLGS